MHKEMIECNNLILGYIVAQEQKKKTLNYSQLSDAPIQDSEIQLSISKN